MPSLALSALQTRVLGNSFGAGRYTTLSTDFLNEAVADACRQLNIGRQYEVLAYDATGVVTQPTRPFFRVESVWLASAGDSTSGEEATRARAQAQLAPLHPLATTLAGGSGSPAYYSTSRSGSLSTGLAITVAPCSIAGMVCVGGLARPTAMSASTDVSGIGGDLDAALIAYAKARCFEFEDDAEMATFWDTRYRLLLGNASLDGDSDGPTVTPGAWSVALPAGVRSSGSGGLSDEIDGGGP